MSQSNRAPRIDNRIQNREGARIFTPLSFLLSGPQVKAPVDIINYHFKGACLRLSDQALGLLHTVPSHNLTFDFYLGKKCFKEQVPFRVAWDSLEQDRLMGVEFVNPIGAFVKRAPRYAAHDYFPPLFTAVDPVDPNRKIFFKVRNLSLNGMLLLSSMSNRHLLLGMELKGLLSFPGQPSISIKLTIQNANDSKLTGMFELGAKIMSGELGAFEREAKLYVLSLSPQTSTEETQEIHREVPIFAKRVKQNLTFRIIENQVEYDKVLRLRFRAYQAHGKVKNGSGWRDQGEGLDQEGSIICAFLNGRSVSSMELRFAVDGTPLRLVSMLGPEALSGVDLNQIVEISRLAVDPNVQGSDIVLGMLQKAHAILVARGGFDVLICATDQLMPSYERIGFKSLDIKFPHPSVPQLNLNVMLLAKEIYLEAKNINAYSWTEVFKETHRFMADIGLVRGVSLSWARKLQVALISRLRSWRRRK